MLSSVLLYCFGNFFTVKPAVGIKLHLCLKV